MHWDQNGLLCIEIGDTSRVLERRSAIPRLLEHLRWGSEEYIEHFAQPSRMCHAMPYGDLHGEEAEDKDVEKSPKDRWADISDTLDTSSEHDHVDSENVDHGVDVNTHTLMNVSIRSHFRVTRRADRHRRDGSNG